jgi:hypothetical protein
MSLEPMKHNAGRTAGVGQSKYDADVSRIECGEQGLKPRQMMGYSLSTGHRHTRAMLPTKEYRRVDRQLDFPGWHRPFVEALLATEPEAVVALFNAAEMAIFARILELSDCNDAAERQDIDRAIEVIQTLRHRAPCNPGIERNLGALGSPISE